MNSTRTRIAWPAILERAAEIVNSYDTSVTLRQLFYRLVSAQLIDNTMSTYQTLSTVTAKARREDDFPDLIDQGREIHQHQSFDSVEGALETLRAAYRLDRTEGQDVSIYLAVEKAGLVEQLSSWFGQLGIPILALSGFASQSYVKDVQEHVYGQDRDAILLYAGDFDPSGEDIDRDFVERTDCWSEVERIALSAEQVATYNLPENAGKHGDSRANQFVERHGRLVQVEVDALDPDDLQALFQAAIDRYWDDDAYKAVLAREVDDLRRLRKLGSG